MKRFDSGADGCIERPDGEYVLFTEYEALRTRYKALRTACEDIHRNWFFTTKALYDSDYAVHRMFTVLEDQQREESR